MGTANDTLKLKVSPVFEQNWDAFNDPSVKIIANQGGTSSTKTYSIAQVLMVKALKKAGELITIVRKTSPSLRVSVMRDFLNILKGNGLYSEENHNKSDREYTLNGNVFEFTSLDEPQKKRGARRDHLWLNEVIPEFTWEDFFQMMIRTRGKIFLDYNPSEEYSWVYDRVLTRKDCRLIKSSYLDNPFLEQTIIDEIERLRDTDENYWKIYGLGETGKRKSIIYDNWDLIDEFPEDCDEEVYGYDFGFNNPSVLLRIGVKDQEHIFIDELIYESKLTNTQLIDRSAQEVTNRRTRASADCAEPDRIEEFLTAGFNMYPCKKGKNSVKDGIDLCKRKKIHVTKRSANTIKEIRAYKWKEDKNERILDEPVPFNDHAMAAMRYGVGELKLDDTAGELFGKQVEVRVVHTPSTRAARERAAARQLSKVTF